MLEQLVNSQFWLDLLPEYGLWIMFISAFLSATLLPGNSELIFTTLVINLFWQTETDLYLASLWLISIAVLGNSLGSLSTYWLGRLFTPPNLDTKHNPRLVWVINQINRFGGWALLFSWLPLVGDLFCAVAGWLRLNAYIATLAISLGKIVRYVFLFILVYASFS